MRSIGARLVFGLAAVILGMVAAPLVAQDALYVAPSGNVGIGTTSPVAPLHIVRNSGALANMLRLTNNGGIQFLLDRTDGNDWQFSNFGASFEISVPGSPVGQLNLAANGDLRISNRVFANNIQLTSSRELKQNFSPIDGREILARLSTMPVLEWSFRSDPAKQRHIGPVAEDFQAAFGLGQEGSSLSLTDVSGVTLAAVKALDEEIRKRDERIALLSASLVELHERLAALEAKLGND